MRLMPLSKFAERAFEAGFAPAGKNSNREGLR